MEIEQRTWTPAGGWEPRPPGELGGPLQLVLAFGATGILEDPESFAMLRRVYPDAVILAGSTAGEILGTRVRDESLSVTAVRFRHTVVRGVQVGMERDAADSRGAGERLAAALAAPELAHVFVLSDGLQVNGSELVTGLTAGLPPGVMVTGGLCGDGERFQRTVVGCDAAPAEGVVAAVGFYGSNLRVGCGSLGGWDPFGPERIVTRSRGNVLFELDGTSALAVYQRYLGEHAAGLPASGLLFPLSVRTAEQPTPVVRTILAIDEEAQSVTFAGDVPEGAVARLMKANFDRLIDGASGAARGSSAALGGSPPRIAVLISCVGRKMVLRQRTEEEVESVQEILGSQAALTGFYSYGEISPVVPGTRCELHNQTMTITTFCEV